MLIFLIEKYVVEGEKLSTRKVLYAAPESVAARRRPFYQTLHASLPVPVVSSTNARIVATTTDTSYLCLGSACHKPEQFTAPSRTKVNQLRIISKQDSHC